MNCANGPVPSGLWSRRKAKIANSRLGKRVDPEDAAHQCRAMTSSDIWDLQTAERLADWDGSAFTSDSESHISIWRKP